MYLLWVFDFLQGLVCRGEGRGRHPCACGCNPRLSYVWNRLEQEAFDHQHDMGYLDSRPCWAWCAYPREEVAKRWLGDSAELQGFGEQGAVP